MLPLPLFPLSHTLLFVVIVQFEFKFHFINLPQPPACRGASAVRSLGALSRTRALFCALSMMFVCLRLQPWTLLCLCTYSLCLWLRCLIDVRFICLRLQPLTTFGLLACALFHSLRLSLLCIHSLIEVRFICLRRLVRLTLTQPSGCLRLSLCLCIHTLSLSLCRCLRWVRHRLRGHRCWRRRHRQSFTNFQCERARLLFTVYSARFVRCCCVCVCRTKCVLEVCVCVYVCVSSPSTYHSPLTNPTTNSPAQIASPFVIHSNLGEIRQSQTFLLLFCCCAAAALLCCCCCNL